MKMPECFAALIGYIDVHFEGEGTHFAKLVSEFQLLQDYQSQIQLFVYLRYLGSGELDQSELAEIWERGIQKGCYNPNEAVKVHFESTSSAQSFFQDLSTAASPQSHCLEKAGNNATT